MTKTIIFVAILFFVAVLFIAVIINGSILAVRHIKHVDSTRIATRIKKNPIALGVVCVMCVGFVVFTQLTASTPAIRNESGKVVVGSIAELREVTLNGRKEWVSMRGYKQNNPVLLFLAGGPGGSQMAAVRHDLSELEKYFVVVNWDQPGSGKSYGALSTSYITTDTYIDDGYALTKYLCDTFNQEKIYVVAFVETEIMDYEKALELAHEKGDTEKIEKLKVNGSPPYYGEDVTWKSAVFVNEIIKLTIE